MCYLRPEVSGQNLGEKRPDPLFRANFGNFAKARCIPGKSDEGRPGKDPFVGIRPSLPLPGVLKYPRVTPDNP